tara:strand:- start:9114 stop:10037 length:924 start_codon:yes stop_codon:yes gene_type:complete
MSIKVINPGLHTTVQDLGRRGYSHLGISGAGAADSISLRLANLLVGNLENDSALEMTLTGGEFLFKKDACIALTGSVFPALMNGEKLPYYRPFQIIKGSKITLGPTQDGARCYLAIRGGFQLPLRLGSCSTHIMTKIGGLDGGVLRKGQEINIGDPDQNKAGIKLDQAIHLDRSILRITRGLQHDWFDSAAWKTLQERPYTISSNFDRMGLRTSGIGIYPITAKHVITEGIPLGAVQIPGNGRPIISFVDHQTTGGYPKIANVITADLCKVGQLRSGDEFQFQLVTMKEAEFLRLDQEKFLNELVKK